MSSSPNTVPVAPPPTAYTHSPNCCSGAQPIQSDEMPWSSENGYQLLSDREKAVPRPQQSATASHPTQTTKSGNDNDGDSADSKRSGSSRSWPSLNPFSRPPSNNPPTDLDEECKKIIHDEGHELSPGIPALAAILDKSFGLYRMFFPEANQILLRRITKISKMVKQLRETDAEFAAYDKHRISTFEIEDDFDRLRAERLDEIETEIYKLYDFFGKFVNIKALARPTERTHMDLYKWILYNRPSIDGEEEWIYHISDLVSSRRKEKEYFSQQGNRLDDLIKWCAGKPGSFLGSLIAQKDETVEFGVTQYDENAKAMARMAVCVLLTVSMLLAPVFILFLIDMPRIIMASIVFFFVLLFTIIVAWLTGGRPQDVLIGTAAYGAILAAFLGNLGGMNQCVVPTT